MAADVASPPPAHRRSLASYIAIVLIVVGVSMALTGELLGVSTDDSGDTITDWVDWLRNRTKLRQGVSVGLIVLLVAIFAFAGWLAYHFTVSS